VSEKQIESQEERSKAAYDRSESAPVRRTEVEIPQAVIDRYEAAQKEAHRQATLSGFFQGMTLVIVAAYTALTYWQWQAMLQQNLNAQQALAVSQQSFETSQRPYVFIKHLTIDPLKVGQQINGSAEWINTGNLPALNAAMAADIAPMKECPQNEAAGTGPRPERDIPPKIEQRPYHVHSRTVLSQDDYNGYMAGTIKICFFEMVVYKDGFDPTRIVKPFCGEQTIKSPNVLICPALNTEYRD